jgi:hypothetical protein
MKTIIQILNSDWSVLSDIEVGRLYEWYRKHPISRATAEITIENLSGNDIEEWKRARSILLDVVNNMPKDSNVTSSQYLEMFEEVYHDYQDGRVPQEETDDCEEEVDMLYSGYVQAILTNSAELLIRMNPEQAAEQIDQLANLMVNKYFER